jgi:peptidoglycan/xylan/chitin deacetylase (PgdA/CDA1 family)
MSLGITLKKAISSVLYFSAGSLVSNHRSKDGCIILAYHRVLPENDERISLTQCGMYVTARTFEEHMGYISKNYTVMPLEELPEAKDLSGTCIITFDDGWSDNYEYAYPILKKYNFPATIFVSTNLMGTTGMPWPDKLYAFVMKATDGMFSRMHAFMEDTLAAPKEELGLLVNLLNNKVLYAEKIISIIKTLDGSQLDVFIGMLDKLMEQQGSGSGVTRPWLSWDEISEMSKNRISFGSHTHNHVLLTNVSEEKAEDEVVLSKQQLSKMINKPVRLFCYPNGNYNNSIVDILKKYDFNIAVTTKPGCFTLKSDFLTIPRIMLHNDISNTVPMFWARINRII